MSTNKKPPTPSTPTAPKKKIPPPGRKMSEKEARDYVFKTYHETFRLLANH